MTWEETAQIIEAAAEAITSAAEAANNGHDEPFAFGSCSEIVADMNDVAGIIRAMTRGNEPGNGTREWVHGTRNQQPREA